MPASNGSRSDASGSKAPPYHSRIVFFSRCRRGERYGRPLAQSGAHGGAARSPCFAWSRRMPPSSGYHPGQRNGGAMGTHYLLGLTAMAFLGPPPVLRRTRPTRRDPPRGTGVTLCFALVFLLAVTVMPLSLALSDKWSIDTFAAECQASGGRLTYLRSEEGRPYSCDRSRK